MKKTLLSLLLFMMVSEIIAQRAKGNIRFGFTVSPNIASLKPVENGITSSGGKMGFSYGIMADYGFSETSFLSTGLHITSTSGTLVYKGNSWPDKKVGVIVADNSSVNNTATYALSFQHLEVPIALKLKTDNGGKLQYWGSFGGTVGFLLKARTDYTSNITVGGVANFGKQNENIIGDIQPLNIGMQIGAGIEYPISANNKLIAGIVYNNGFIDVTRNSKWSDDGRVNLNNFTLRLGVTF